MEDTPGPDSPLQDKFEERLRSERATDALVYWPRGAKTVTLQQEFVILFGKQPKLRVWVLPEVGVLHFHQGYAIVDGEDRGRYSNDLLNAATILPWGTRDDLDQHVERLAAGLHALDE